MRNKLFPFLFVLLFSISASSQTSKKIDEFSDGIPCGEMSMRIDSYLHELHNKPQNKLYVIYYEGITSVSVYNSETKEYDKILKKSRFGSALSRAKEIPLYLKMAYKIPKNRVILINGGFRRELELEVWSVSDGAEIPKPTSTIERKDIKFAKGKPYGVRKLALCYAGY